LSFNTGLLHHPFAANFAWHHWGAYIASAETMLAGARPFLDVPLQYGLGPTALIAGFCGGNCWYAMYFLVGSTTLAFAFFIWLMVLSITQKRLSIASGLLLVALSILCCFFWAAYPPDIISPIITPSYSGLRFLPVTAFVAGLILHSDRDQFSGPPQWGHLAWAIGTLWSPESAFYTTFVWWPYFLWTGSLNKTGLDLAKTLLYRLVLLVVSLVLLCVAFLLGYWLAYRTMPSFYGYFSYALYPPKVIPLVYSGAFSWFILVLFLGFASLLHSFKSAGASRDCRRIFLLLLLCYGCFSYYLGRSHDNNILNLLPFQFLVLLAALRTLKADELKGLAAAMLACLIGWTCVFGWNIVLDAKRAGHIAEYKPKEMIARFSRRPPDVITAMQFIRTNFGEPITILDENMNLVMENSPMVWSANHFPGNLMYLPQEVRRQFLTNTANTLQRSGWLIIGPSTEYGKNIEEIMQDFDTVYSRKQTLLSGKYRGIRYVPKMLTPVSP
jgi:hypothetical protein